MRPDARQLAGRLCQLAPVFRLTSPDQISFLASPAEYYDRIMDGIRAASERLCLASLYVGVGSREAAMVDAIRAKLVEKAGSATFAAHIHIDYLRGTRPDVATGCSSVSILAPLLAPLLGGDTASPSARASSEPLMLRGGGGGEDPAAQARPPIKVSLYKTPQLHGSSWRSYVVPARLNEVFGLSHLKVCIFDDTLIITGANLSETYFTDRIDRYICIRNHPQLAAYFAGLLETISIFSHSLESAPAQASASFVIAPPSLAIEGAGGAIRAFIDAAIAEQAPLEGASSEEPLSSFIVPTVQMAAIRVRQDEHILSELFQWARAAAAPEGPTAAMAACMNVHLSTAYFNISKRALAIFQDRHRQDDRQRRQGARTTWHILTSSPAANGFWGAAGLAGHIPAIYRAISAKFVSSSNAKGGMCLAHNAQGHPSIYEYDRAPWLFHAKGLWINFVRALPGGGLHTGDALEEPSALDACDSEACVEQFALSIIGSSNFGHRSFDRDLEAQIVLFTNEPRLIDTMREDRDGLFAHGSLLSAREMRRKDATPVITLLHRIAAALFGSFF